ncbi:MAG: hypothetical protein A3E87_06810 [Gammaproteobacteria bacterium RIFCSPHIGHO2_12_FULL_35_23]|nr:MAG: hypothetical protein A3E87_06810 [Gammaproteobacteria bacterium RIFCSPHIGHO2_12_FULL_35_23]
MNYRHVFHAGNFADVFKHCVLINLLFALQRKGKPFFFLDTHAGLGYYNLISEAAKKACEFESGINRLLAINTEKLPLAVKKYLEIINQLNNNKAIQYYPGSPYCARSLLRPMDRMVACELHPEDYLHLKQVFVRDKQVQIQHENGYSSLKALLPPKERRGLVLIDPPFEQENEYEQIRLSLQNGLKRWQTGIYAVWYPIKSGSPPSEYLSKLKEDLKTEILLIEFCIDDRVAYQKLCACGMVIINPPFKMKEELAELLKFLWMALSPYQQGFYRLKYL